MPAPYSRLHLTGSYSLLAVLFGLLLSVACSAKGPTEPEALLACTRSYVDADAHVAACYPICPADMEAYARATGMTFTRSASCAF